MKKWRVRAEARVTPAALGNYTLLASTLRNVKYNEQEMLLCFQNYVDPLSREQSVPKRAEF